MVAVPTTRTRLSHALTIRAGGRVIGAVHLWSPSQSRTVDHEFEVEANAVGLPVDLVPGVVDRRELRITRYDLYTAVMEEVFGSFELVNLTDQFRPFSLREVWAGPGIGSELVGSLANIAGASPVLAAGLSGGIGSFLGGGTNRQYEYAGCWFTDVGRTIDAKGDRVVSVEATIAYLRKNRIR